MISCLTAARMTMEADVYEQIKTIDPLTNYVSRSWQFLKTIKCTASPYTDGGRYNFGVSEDYGQREYIKEDFVRVRSMDRLSDKWRIKNIRDAKTQTLIWIEDDNNGIEFNVDGSAPIINQLQGLPVEYLSTLSRVDVNG